MTADLGSEEEGKPRELLMVSMVVDKSGNGSLSGWSMGCGSCRWVVQK